MLYPLPHIPLVPQAGLNEGLFKLFLFKSNENNLHEDSKPNDNDIGCQRSHE